MYPNESRIVEPDDAEYPAGLRELRDPPKRLYVAGTLPEGGIAIVGSRYPPKAAIGFAYELARRSKVPVVSGLAIGVDAAAHRGALDGGVATLAYLANGFGATYPRAHRDLERRIVERGGAIATERNPKERVTNWALVKRDRLQAAHARALVLVASEADGGAMHTVRAARQLERPIYVLQPPAGSHGDEQWEGNVKAIAAGGIALPINVGAALTLIA